MNYEVKEQLYEGKAKQVFATNDPEIVMVHYKDDATAGDGEKKGTIRDKGIVNNKLSNALMQKLEKEGIPTHYVQEVNDRDTFVKKVEIVPLEVIVRNVAAGHFSLRMGVPEGKVFKTPILEYSYKNDDLHDPFINHYYALALDLATQEELDTIAKYAFKVNEVLKKIMLDANIRLVDFKLEFGRLSDGTIILADEISPDTCRFWDATTWADCTRIIYRALSRRGAFPMRPQEAADPRTDIGSAPTALPFRQLEQINERNFPIHRVPARGVRRVRYV